MGAPAPIYRSQGNQQFRSEQQNSQLKRGQSVPYDLNGAPVTPTWAEEPGFLAINVEGLAPPSVVDPAVPLYEYEVPTGVDDVIFNGNNAITARVAATGSTVLPIKKNGAANGNITYSGATGTMTMSDSTYAPGDLFSLYPPATADATLDGLRMSLGVN